MNQTYEVIYSLGNREQSGMFTGTGGLQYLRATVQATSATNAQSMVEAMNGGTNHCLASAGTLVNVKNFG